MALDRDGCLAFAFSHDQTLREAQRSQIHSRGSEAPVVDRRTPDGSRRACENGKCGSRPSDDGVFQLSPAADRANDLTSRCGSEILRSVLTALKRSLAPNPFGADLVSR